MPCRSRRLTRHPSHGALKRKPSEIPAATVERPWCFSQFRLSFFRRRVGTPPLQRTSAQATPHRPVSARTTKKRNQATSRFQTRRLFGRGDAPLLRPCHGKSTRLGACGVGG